MNQLNYDETGLSVEWNVEVNSMQSSFVCFLRMFVDELKILRNTLSLCAHVVLIYRRVFMFIGDGKMC